MPELPEVETAARTLAAQVAGRQIIAIEKLDWERMLETPSIADFQTLLPGRHIQAVGRRAKWLLLTLDADWTLALHLRMSGNIFVVNSDIEPDQYTHFVLALDDGQRVFFHDQRKFGKIRLLDLMGLTALDANHGPEPLSDQFTPAVLAHILSQRATRLKILLLDQSRIAGLGNIYVNDALWLAQLHPLRTANSLQSDEIERLYNAIRTVLTQAIENKGSTLRNYRNGYGEQGQNQNYFLVYNREGQPCSHCGAIIERLVIAQRSAYVCPTCQSCRESPAQAQKYNISDK